MSKANALILAFNRGVVSKLSLARTDIERMALSAETMKNWIPKTQGPMRIRPGQQYCGSSLNDTGATWIDFVARTNDAALVEVTNAKVRVWLADTGTPNLLGRPNIATTLTIEDTGWSNASSGGQVTSGSASDIIPVMTGYTTSNVTISASSDNSNGDGGLAWYAADDDQSTYWTDTGATSVPALPSWWNVDFDDAGTDTGNYYSVTSYSIRADDSSQGAGRAPEAWRLITGNYDTGTYATDTGKWVLEDAQSGQTSWAISEKRTFTLPGSDTGTVEARRHWRLYFTEANDNREMRVSEVQMLTAATTQQVRVEAGTRILNALTRGARAETRKKVVVDTGDQNVEHSLDIHISRGPVNFRVGSTAGDDDYVSEAVLYTGYHNIAFTPSGDFHISFSNDDIVDRVIATSSIGDTGTVEITSPWTEPDLDNMRWAQSADVLFVACDDVKQQRIERRSSGRSWSVVEYDPVKGPFLSVRTSKAKLDVSRKYGNTTMTSNVPFFVPNHVGTLIRATHDGQSGEWPLGAVDAMTDAVEVVGVSDTGTPSSTNERRITIATSGTYVGTIAIERSVDGPDFGFHPISADLGTASDTGTFTTAIDDPSDNLSVWYRAKMTAYTSGAAIVNITYTSGFKTGIAKVVEYNSNTSVDIEVQETFSDTGPTDEWQEERWSDAQRFPSEVALYEGRLWWFARQDIDGSASDDYHNFDDTTEGDAAPVIRTIGEGPLDDIVFSLGLQRMILGTIGTVLSLRSTAFDEPLTQTNISAKPITTQGAAALKAVRVDSRGVYVHSSTKRLFDVFYDIERNGYRPRELTDLSPDILSAGVVAIAVQRQPDTRIHCVLADGTVAIFTYEPEEELLCWSTYETDGTVEKAVVLPGIEEDQVYYHVNRTINGATKRFLEKWALESQTLGGTVTKLADCFVKTTDTGSTLTGLDHLEGETVTLWRSGKDRGTFTVSGGSITDTGTQGDTGVVGLAYTADYKSTKLAYAADMGTALLQPKRVSRIGLMLSDVHHKGLKYGGDTGNLDDLPDHLFTVSGARKTDTGQILTTFDQASFPFNGNWDTDSRIYLRATAPRPVTVLAAVVSINTKDNI